VKINKLGTGSAPLVAERDSAARTERPEEFFSGDLAKAQSDLSQEKLKELLDKITAQGKKLGEVPTYAELKAYRELVRSFLSETVSRAYTLESQAGWDRHGRQKVYTIVKKIDGELAGLTEDVRHGQERQLQIMNRLDAIRGMLVDLYS
jgi:uncharacterized protein YaaR (DUF327 family)